MAPGEALTVEVVYALPEAQDVVEVELAPGATLRQAIAASGLLERHPDIDLERDGAGVFGRLRPLDSLVAAGDRVEIYRPLQVDPKAERRARAARRG